MHPLLDRDREIAGLHRLLDAAAKGAGGLLLIEGDAGIGKTALIQAARGLAAERGIRTLTARGAELERELAFGLARELLYCAVDGPGARFEGAAALAKRVLIPGPSTSGSRQDLFATLHGLYWFTAGLAAATPILLAVDDAHWCDLPSLRFIAYLAHRLDGLPVSLLLATRPTTGDPARQELLGALAAEPLTMVSRPAPLGSPAVRTLVAHVLGEPDRQFADACREATGGNPFLLRELLAELHSAGTVPRADEVPCIADVVPHEVQRSVRIRLARLAPEAAALARAAAILGDGADPRLAAALAGIPDDALAVAADALVAARLVEPAPALRFLHPLLRSAAAATMGPAELAVGHRTAAAMLAADGETGDVLVPHLMAARPTGDPWTVDVLRDAARRASGRGAPEVAARFLRRALAEPPPGPVRPSILLELGLAEMQAGELDALVHLTAAADGAADAEARARATLPLARALLQSGRVKEAVRRCERAIDDLDDGTELALELDAELVTIATQDPDTRAVTVARHARRGRDPEPTTRAGCLLLASLALEELITAGSRERAVKLAELALTDGHLLHEQFIARLPSVGIALTYAGRPARAVHMWDRAIPRLRERGEVGGFALATAFRGYAAYYTGDLQATLADTRLAVELSQDAALQVLTQGFATAWLTYALIDIGEYAAADDLFTDNAALLQGPASSVQYLHSARGQLRLAQGRLDEAVEDLQACGRQLAKSGSTGPMVCRWRAHLALALLGRGERDQARAVAADAVRRARAWGAPYPMAEALRAAGVVEAGEHGVRLLREAAAVAAEAPLERARAVVALGGLLRRSGHRSAAREPLRQGLDLALAGGATAVANTAHDELVASGARPRRLRSTGADALTPTERRVAAMAAGGQTSRAVAQALFVSEKTVETHLRHAYRKLGITARSQLPDALGTPGLKVSGDAMQPSRTL